MSDAKQKDPAGKFRPFVKILASFLAVFLASLAGELLRLPEYFRGWLCCAAFFISWDYFKKIADSWKND